MSSPEYQGLVTGIGELKSHLMNYAPRLEGNYTTEELMKCRAFIAFSHAEIQSYLEKIAKRILVEAHDRWIKSFAVDRVIATLVAFRRQPQISIPEDPGKPHKSADIYEIVSHAFKLQEDVISKNNGIKRSNVSEILCPLGMFPKDFDEVLLIQLDGTGKLRGDLVHNVSSVSLRRIRDPFSDEIADIEQLIAEIEKLDDKLTSLGLLSVLAPSGPMVEVGRGQTAPTGASR
jgi:hypothetical protein